MAVNRSRKKATVLMVGVVCLMAINHILIHRERRWFFLDGSEGS